MRMFPPRLVWWQCHLPPLSQRGNISRNDQGNSAAICNEDRLVIAKDQVLIMNNIVTKQPTEKSQLRQLREAFLTEATPQQKQR